MIFGTHHICIKVTDLARSRAFYGEALGFTEEAVIRHTPAVISCFMLAADGALRIQLLSAPGAAAEHTGYGHLGMAVRDIRESYAFHRRLGAVSQEIVEQPHQFGYFIRDPDGYEIELCQLKDRESTAKERNTPYEDYKH